MIEELSTGGIGIQENSFRCAVRARPAAGNVLFTMALRLSDFAKGGE
jgi:hypothetical protein